MTIPIPIIGPHAHGGESISHTMGLVLLALIPATLFGLIQFGWPALYLFLTTLAAALLFEALGLGLAGHSLRPLGDRSALLTGWLLAMTLPPWAPWWIGVVGAALAILVGKQVFGGLGQNLFNPAMVARVALLIAFPLPMTTFVAPQAIFDPGAPGAAGALAISLGGTSLDGISGASLLGHVRAELGRGLGLDAILAGGYDPWQQLWGHTAGSLGETSAVPLLLGGLFLLSRRIITWHIPAALLGVLALLATLTHGLDPGRYPGAVYHLLSGATLLGAFFISTDPVTSPVSARGQLLFGAGCGLLVFVIRTWAGYPEGMAFAVLLMNACTPLIDHYLRPRIYGRDSRGVPLNYADAAERRP